MKVILAGGGTGGHLYPAIAIAEQLKEKEINTIFLVSNRGIERKILSNLGYEFIEQNTVAFKGKNIFNKFKAIYCLLKEIINSSKIINKNDKIILFGGFAAASAGIVARLKKIEYYIHEQNSVMGMVNKFFAKSAKKVFLSFDNTKNAIGNTLVVGNPVRKEFAFAQAKKELTKNILIIGGSQGSRVINNLIVNSADELINKGFRIKHQTGEKLYSEVVEGYKEIENKVEILPYIDSIKDAYNWADIIISRAGSGSVFEIMYSKRPAIFIPFKAASDNHQKYNAIEAEKKINAYIIDEDNATKENLFKIIEDIYVNYTEIYKKLDAIEFKDTAQEIITEIGID